MFACDVINNDNINKYGKFKTRKGFYVPKYDDINSRLVY